jgi:hypothetical protein
VVGGSARPRFCGAGGAGQEDREAEPWWRLGGATERGVLGGGRTVKGDGRAARRRLEGRPEQRERWPAGAMLGCWF